MSVAGRAAVIGLVRAITPSVEPADHFVCEADASGGSVSLESRAHVMRQFEIRTVGFMQGDIASATPVQWVERWELVVSYPNRWGDDDERIRQTVLSDMRQIVAAIQPPSGWLASLSNLHVGHEEVDLSPVAGAGGEVIAFHASLPIVVEYFQTP